ncbi:MAG: hypothetical protein CTY24_01890 [Methylobacter sp.]|nr:MAG: hypothetical protein CTY24_01890 [Methylobacter sp.]
MANRLGGNMAVKSKKIILEQTVESVEAETTVSTIAEDEALEMPDDFELAELEPEVLALLAETNPSAEAFSLTEDDDNPLDELMALDVETETSNTDVLAPEEDDQVDLSDETETMQAEEDVDQPEAETETPEPTVVLAQTLSIQHVGELHEQLKKVLQANAFIEINAAEVTAIDTCSLQLLVALKQCADNQGKPFLLTEPSGRFVESANLLGLADVFELPG